MMRCTNCVRVPDPILASVRLALRESGVPSQFVAQTAVELSTGHVDESDIQALVEWGRRHPDGHPLLGGAVDWAVTAAAASEEPLARINRKLRVEAPRWVQRDLTAHQTLSGMVEVALADGIRKAGGKIREKINAAAKINADGKKGPVGSAICEAVAAADCMHWASRDIVPDHIFAALGITEIEALQNAFRTLEERSRLFLRRELDDRLRAISATLAVPLARVREQWGKYTDDRSEVAAAVLAGLVFGLAARRLREPDLGLDGPGETLPVAGAVPPPLVSEVLDAAGGAPVTDGEGGLRVAYDQRTGEILDVDGRSLPSGLHAGPDTAGIIETEAAAMADMRVRWVQGSRWEWGYFGTPSTPFKPHEDLDGVPMTSLADRTELGFEAQRGGEGPPVQDFWIPRAEQTSWYPGDHDGCRCKLVPTHTFLEGVPAA